MPDVDNMGANMSYSKLIPAHLEFGAKSRNWLASANTAISDTLLTLLPINSVSTLTVKSITGLSKEFWLAHILRWPLLKQASLNPCGHLSLFSWLWLRLALALWNFDLNQHLITFFGLNPWLLTLAQCWKLFNNNFLMLTLAQCLKLLIYILRIIMM